MAWKQWALSLGYVGVAAVLSPWLYVRRRRGKPIGCLYEKCTGAVQVERSQDPAVWWHGVSVGEILLLRPLVRAFGQRFPGRQQVVSATTPTGLELARREFADLPVIPWPFDFVWAVRRALDRVRPELLVLAELELWPNLLVEAGRRGIPVAIVNARLSERSFRRYFPLRHWLREALVAVHLVAAQNETYARRFAQLGIAPARIHVTGSVKFDSGTSANDCEKLHQFRTWLAVRPGQTIWVVGSTQAPEEAMALRIFAKLRRSHPGLRLVLVPRHRERFEEVASSIRSMGLTWARRSEHPTTLTGTEQVVLWDTLGELRVLWGLADVAFVGGSLADRGGQNMIEPAAFGVAPVFGPHVWNFQDIAQGLLAAGGALQVADAADWEEVTRRLLSDPAYRRTLGARARCFVQSHAGATQRTLDLLVPLLAAKGCGTARAA
ncbi:MAG: 3-deoxy-D-manno-octulosonic acid transferase [Gemmataceae bacterium]